MEDPRTELEPAVNAFLLRIFAGTQDAAIETFFTPDAGLIHPLCFIPRSRGSDHGTRSPYMQCSRDRIKTVYRRVYSVNSPIFHGRNVHLWETDFSLDGIEKLVLI